MGFFDRLASQEPLMQGMAQRMGVDFADWIGRDPQRAGDYRTAVLTCAGCKAGDACRGWQADHATATDAPAFCRNRHLLATLRDA